MIPVDSLLQKGASYRKVGPGDIVFNEGTTAVYYYQLITGQIRWCSITDDGREILHRVVEPGGSIGEFPLFDDEPYAASAIADAPSILLRLPIQSFHELLREYPDIHLRFTKSLVQHLRFKFFLTTLQSENSPEKIISRLISYFNQQGKFICQDCNRLLLTRQQLANMTGLRVETVIRAIKHMEKEERISIVKGKVFVPADGLGCCI